jgi:hypothetical protein
MESLDWKIIIAALGWITSIVLFIIKLRTDQTNLLENLRPELILLDWTRFEEGGHEVIAFRKIKNVGRGAAFNVEVGGRRNYPTVIICGVRLDAIGPNETIDVDGRMLVSWGNVKAPNEGEFYKHTEISIEITFTDIRDVPHSIDYDISACYPAIKTPTIQTSSDLTIGLFRRKRTTTRKSGWKYWMEKSGWKHRIEKWKNPKGRPTKPPARPFIVGLTFKNDDEATTP